MEQPLVLNLDEILKRIGYGRYQVFAFLAVAAVEFSFGLEIILIGVFEKYLKGTTDHSDTTISMLCTFIAVGFPIGLTISLFLTFRFGRLTVLKISHLLIICSALGSAIKFHDYVFVAFRVCANMGIGMGVPLIYSFIVESSPSNKRGYFSILVECAFITGQLTALSLVYCLMPDVDGENWFYVYFAPYVALFLPTLSLFFYLKETPWYLFKKGRTEEMFEALEFISKQNSGISLSEAEKKIDVVCDTTEVRITAGLKILFNKENRGTILKLTWVRISLTVGFIGTVFFIPFMFQIDNFYLSYVICIASIVPFLIIAVFMVESSYFGRKNTLFTNEIVLTCMSLMLIVFRDSKSIAAVIIGCICGMSSVTNNISAQFVSELFETNVRVAASTMINLISRSQLAYLIFIINLLTQVPVVLFAILSMFFALAGFALFTFNRDTRGKVLDSKHKSS